MTRGAEIYVRIITFLVGLVLTALGIVCILWYCLLYTSDAADDCSIV